MGLQTAPGYIGQGSFQTPVELDRNWVAAVGGRRSGRIRYNDFALTPSPTAMQMTIAKGDAVVMGAETSTIQGGYYAWSNASETINWPAAAGSPRIDSLILRVIDTQYGTDGSGNGALWQVVSGTPSGSPVAVTNAQLDAGGALHRPGGYLRVADVLVPASVTNLSTATVSNNLRFARIGRSTLCNFADLPADAQIGDEATVLDDYNNKVIWSGSSWVGAGEGGAWNSLAPYLTSGFTQNTFGYAPQYKLQGNTVRLRGNVLKTAAGGMVTSTVFLTLPTFLRPAFHSYFSQPTSLVTSSGYLTRVDVPPNGAMGVGFANGYTNTFLPLWVSLDGICFDIF